MLRCKLRFPQYDRKKNPRPFIEKSNPGLSRKDYRIEKSAPEIAAPRGSPCLVIEVRGGPSARAIQVRFGRHKSRGKGS